MNAHIENINFYNDSRNCEPEKKQVVYIEHADGGIGEIELSTIWGVCDLCKGEGKHINPSIDCGGITAEEFHDDPDFAEDYMSGIYDIPCNKCGGRTTIHVVDWDALTPDIRAAYEQQLKEEAFDSAQNLAEIQMGA